MNRYSTERKEAVLKKMAPPNNISVPELAEQEGTAIQTLYNWRKQARSEGHVLPAKSDTTENWSSEEKFRVVLETALLSEIELSTYCREKGIYPEQIERWKQACLFANACAEKQSKADKKAANKQRHKIKKLERELNRKDKALAETAALLALSKKAEAIWGTNDEED